MLSDCDYSHAVQHSRATGFLANVRAEVTHQVLRTSHHPSVALWLSNNEITAGTGKKECLQKGGRSCWQVLFLDTIMDAIVAVDRSRPLWPYSHSDGWASGVDPETNLRVRDDAPLVMRNERVPDSSHEVHQYYFGADTCDCTADFSALDSPRKDGIFPDSAHSSEYGWVGAPSFDSFRRYSNASDWNINSSLFVHSQNRIVHQSQLLTRLVYNFPAEATTILHQTGEPSIRRVTYLSQLLQALCLRQESEHYRRGRDFSPGVAARPNPGGGVQGRQNHTLFPPPKPRSNHGSCAQIRV